MRNEKWKFPASILDFHLTVNHVYNSSGLTILNLDELLRCTCLLAFGIFGVFWFKRQCIILNNLKPRIMINRYIVIDIMYFIYEYTNTFIQLIVNIEISWSSTDRHAI